jgi:hypothetical protein
MRWLRTVRGRESARQAEPSTLVLNEPSCYHFRVLDPLRATDRELSGKSGEDLRAALTVGEALRFLSA